MAAAGVGNWNHSESIQFRTLKKYPEYNTSNESESEPELEAIKRKSKWIENDDPENEPSRDPAYIVLYDYAKGKKPCMPYTDETGNEYFVHVFTPHPQNVYQLTMEEFRKHYLTIRKKIHDLTQYYTSSTFPDAPDGIYTWILGDKGKFFAGRVRSILEIGTTHKQLADASKSKHIYVGGECSKSGKKIYFNIQSGSFSVKIIRRNNTTGLNEETKQQRLQAKGQAAFESMGLTAFGYIGSYSLINSETVPITKKELQQYVHAGFDVYLYKNSDDCKADLFTTKYPRAIRFQEGGRRKTRVKQVYSRRRKITRKVSKRLK